MPEGWNPDTGDERITRQRERAQIPEEVVHRSKTVMALAQIQRALGNGVAGRYVTADELYGGAPWWRAELARLGLIYVVEVPNRVCGWIDEPSGEARSLAGLAVSHPRLRGGRKQRYTTHETDKGPEVWECRRVRFVEQAKAAPADPQSLLVARNVRTAETKFFLTHAPRAMSTAACLKVAFSRWRIERCFQDCQGELGLNHAEIRTYRGLRRHFILTTINYYFRQRQVRERGEKNLTVAQLADATQVILARRVEGIMTEAQILILAERLACHIERTQGRNRTARLSARRRRVQELADLGIDPNALILCDQCSL